MSSGEKDTGAVDVSVANRSEVTDPAGEKTPARAGDPVIVSQGDADDTTYFYNVNKDKAGPLTPEKEGRLIRKNF